MAESVRGNSLLPAKPTLHDSMEYLDNSIKRRSFLRLRSNVYKPLPMGKLDTKIDKFLAENNVNYHRKWAVKLSSPGRKQRRFIVSFYLPEANIMLDMADDPTDMSLYDLCRHKELVWRFGDYPHAVDAILPVDKNQSWREVKKQLQLLIQK